MRISFAAYNKGFIPDQAIMSYDNYQGLDKLIDHYWKLPKRYFAHAWKEISKTWLAYSEKGSYAYDFPGAHIEVKLGQNDLISKPQEPLTTASGSVSQAVPSFNLVFDRDLSFDKLQLCENKNGMFNKSVAAR